MSYCLIRNVLLSLSSLVVAFAASAQLEVVSSAPPFKAVLPGLQPAQLGPHPMREGRPQLRLYGSSGGTTISVLVPTAEAGMTALQCAGATLNGLPLRAGVPELAKIHRKVLDERTYLALYSSNALGPTTMHAHLMSAAGGTHCVEIHASKVVSSLAEVEPWFLGFESARFLDAP